MRLILFHVRVPLLMEALVVVAAKFPMVVQTLHSLAMGVILQIAIVQLNTAVPIPPLQENLRVMVTERILAVVLRLVVGHTVL